LNKKNYEYAVLIGGNNSGIFEFLEHYANTKASNGTLVIVRKI
jgi:hypothetical protein